MFFPTMLKGLDTATCKSTYYVIKQNTVSLFHESSCGRPLPNGYHILQPWIEYIQCIWQIFLLKACCNFKGVLSAIYSSGTVIFTGGHLQWSTILKGTVFLWNKHLQSSLFSKILSQFAIPVAVIHSTNGPFSVIKEQLQPEILLNLTQNKLKVYKHLKTMPIFCYYTRGVNILNIKGFFDALSLRGLKRMFHYETLVDLK